MTSLATSLAKQLIVQVVVNNMTSSALVKTQQTKGGLQHCSTTSVVMPHTLLASMAKQCPNAIQTMTNQHPITPPPELVREWREEPAFSALSPCSMVSLTTTKLQDIATRAAQWGADQELEGND